MAVTFAPALGPSYILWLAANATDLRGFGGGQRGRAVASRKVLDDDGRADVEDINHADKV